VMEFFQNEVHCNICFVQLTNICIANLEFLYLTAHQCNNLCCSYK